MLGGCSVTTSQLRTPASSAGSVRPTSLRPRRFGVTEPRIYTPPLRKLTPKSSLGFACIEFCHDVLGIQLYPWQQWLLKAILETLPDGSLRFRTVIVLVARQNGKSTLSVILSLFFMYVLARDLVIGTAQDLDVAEEIWQAAVDIVEDTPELDLLKERVVKVNGKKSLELKTGERYKVKAANRRAGRGLSGDLVLLDELREHQSWDAWGAITKTTMARAFALIVALSNAGDASSVVLRYLRKMAHLALGDPDGINAADDPGAEPAEDDVDVDDDSLGIFEWSAPAGCDIWDRDGWAQANPSLGYAITERTVAAAARTDPEWIFRTEVLCQWSDGSLEGPFPPGSWEAGQVDASSQIVGSVKACVDVSVDRSRAHIAFAGRTADGSPQVELVAANLPVEYVKGWLSDPKRRDLIDEVTGQSRGAPVSSLMGELAVAGLPVADWQGSDVPNATAAFYDLVRGEGLLHTGPNPPLDIAAATAVPKMTDGGAFMWDRKRSPTDIAPLVAATGAVWLLTKPTEEPAVSAYESRGLLTI